MYVTTNNYRFHQFALLLTVSYHQRLRHKRLRHMHVQIVCIYTLHLFFPSPLSPSDGDGTHSNCRDYDLCERCERESDKIHPPEHIFLKVKVPCLWLGRDSSGFMRPLLPYVVYSSTVGLRYCYCTYIQYTVVVTCMVKCTS